MKYKCTIENCNKEYKTKHSSNFTKHILANHKTFYENEILNAYNENEILNAYNENQNLSKNQKSITDFTSSNNSKVYSINLQLNLDKFIKSCISLICSSLRPFSMINDTGFKEIVDPIAKQMNLTINRQNIKEYIFEHANKHRENLKKLFKNKILSIKIDGCSRMGRHFIGINIQLIIGDKIEIFNLDSDINDIENEQESEDVFEEGIIDDQKFLDIENCEITTIRCGAHTLQLAINDFL